MGGETKHIEHALESVSTKMAELFEQVYRTPLAKKNALWVVGGSCHAPLLMPRDYLTRKRWSHRGPHDTRAAPPLGASFQGGINDVIKAGAAPILKAMDQRIDEELQGVAGAWHPFETSA